MADLGCSPNAAVAFDFLVGKGIRDFQAAAIVGNLQQESALNPTATFEKESSYGIAQWRLDRWQNLNAFASSSGRNPWSLDVQLEFLWYELQTRPELGLQQLLASTTIEDAVVTFQNLFERCGNCMTQNRVSYAKSALYACPKVKPPLGIARGGGVVTAAVGVFALVAAVGYTIYEALSSREEPGPEPYRFPPPYRPRPPFGGPP